MKASGWKIGPSGPRVVTIGAFGLALAATARISHDGINVTATRAACPYIRLQRVAASPEEFSMTDGSVNFSQASRFGFKGDSEMGLGVRASRWTNGVRLSLWMVSTSVATLLLGGTLFGATPY